MWHPTPGDRRCAKSLPGLPDAPARPSWRGNSRGQGLTARSLSVTQTSWVRIGVGTVLSLISWREDFKCQAENDFQGQIGVIHGSSRAVGGLC